jgi:hypothetical protein
MAPSAPPAPAGPAPQQPPPQSQTPAAATQSDAAAMAQWQAQNAHPVMSSADALKWMKNQTTLAQDATYLPMGGPGGSPYAFHIKGGGINTVPVSQMISKGAGPLVAAQNTSAVLSQTDQMQQPGAMPSGTGAGAAQPSASAGTPPPAQPPQQYPNVSPPPPGPVQQPAQPQPGGQTWNPLRPAPLAGPGAPVPPPPAPGMPSGTGAGAPQPVAVTPGPPAAPGPQAPITDIYGTPMGSYTNVPSKGGPANIMVIRCR